MLRYLLVVITYVLLTGTVSAQQNVAVKLLPEFCVSPAELLLYKKINEYRRQKGLPEVKLSVSLCYVARVHAKDQTDNFKSGGHCNMHSWSDKGNWSSCCYTPDHKKGQCMWDKPRELTNYQANGYEISFWSNFESVTSDDAAKDILDGWKRSPGHNDVIINRNIWKSVKWNAIGVGIYNEYADVWFGEETDDAGEPNLCN